MANTYTQIHIQIVFAVQNRHCLIRKVWQDELYRYITGIIQKENHKLLAINGMADHLHLLLGMRPTQSLSGLVQDIKSGSSKWINERGFVKGKFSWQEGYGAFSYSKQDISNIIQYIASQEDHHRKKSFREEYLELLKQSHISFDDRYIFTQVNVDDSIEEYQSTPE